jgi:hypothetical protein
MNEYNFTFNPKDCSSEYFKELVLFLNTLNEESFDRLDDIQISKIRMRVDCTHPINDCKQDEFFFENKRQIVLGRFSDMVSCFSNCKSYFTMLLDPYSVLKNDIFIHYIFQHPHLCINDCKDKIEIETVFPIRIILSKDNIIPTHIDTQLTNVNNYIYDTIQNKLASSVHNTKKYLQLKNDSILKSRLTIQENGHITARELCLLRYMNTFFYIVPTLNGTIKPFILVSKYNLAELKQIFKKYNKPFPPLEYLYD